MKAGRTYSVHDGKYVEVVPEQTGKAKDDSEPIQLTNVLVERKEVAIVRKDQNP